MAEVYISTRCKKILYMIIATDDYIPLKQISEELRLSKRSIYYELCKINDWLATQGISEIEVVRGKGIRLSEQMKQQIEEVMEGGNTNDSYIFSPMERIYFIICYIIKSKKAVSVEQLTECLQVSRNTIFNDIRVVVNQLQDYDLQLEYESKKGYLIKGDCIRIRALFILYFNMLRPLYESGALEYIVGEETKENLKKLEAIESRLNTSYVDGTLLALAAIIDLMEENNSDLYFPSLRVNELMESTEYKLVEEYFPKLGDDEKKYLCLHLLGSRVSMRSVEVFDNESVRSNYELAKALVAEFEKVACVIFEDREELERSIYFHLNTSMYRFQYGIQVGNPMLDDIIREYRDLFELTKIVTRYLEHQIGLPINDGEVAYLALHFGAHLRKEKHNNEKIRVLIVCSNGISAGNMIKHELLKMLPNIDIVGVVSAKEAVNIHNICDIVVTTLKLNCLVPVIVVHPILTDFDRKMILNHSMFRNLSSNVDINELLKIINKYVPKERQKSLRIELDTYFESRQSDVMPLLDKMRKGLTDMLISEKVLIENESMTWENALRIAASPLLKDDTISEKYVDSIISQTRYYGPYMFITKDVVLAHAKPEDGVNKMGISFGVFKEPIVFSDFHQARIIILLAAKDQEKHLRILKDIMTIFSEESNVMELVKQDNSENVIECLNKFLKP